MAKVVNPMRRGIAGWINDALSVVAPSVALRREADLTRMRLLKHQAGPYNGAGGSARASDFSRNTSDAVETMRDARGAMSLHVRHMLRNNPRVVKATRALRGQVVGAGILPGVTWKAEGTDRAAEVLELIKAHCNHSHFDTDGLRNMAKMQGDGFSTCVGDGEVILRRRMRRPGDGLPLNFQVQMLEADFLDQNVDGPLPGGNRAVQGIEFDAIGRRVAYHLFRNHPGSIYGTGGTVRVAAENIIHLFDPVRAGAQRGVTWFAPVITLLHELDKYQGAQVKRQEIAAMFAGILKSDQEGEDAELEELSAGAILNIGDTDSLEFTDPPSVDGYEPFMRGTDRAIAAGIGITYEAMTGDYSTVNYTSGRMGRMDVDPNIRDWQFNLMIPTVCQRFGNWIAEGVQDVTDIPPDAYAIPWTPPVRPVVDPAKDYKAAETAIGSGIKSRRQVIRENGGNPDEVEAEIIAEREWQADHDVTFTSSADAGADTTQEQDT